MNEMRKTEEELLSMNAALSKKRREWNERKARIDETQVCLDHSYRPGSEDRTRARTNNVLQMISSGKLNITSTLCSKRQTMIYLQILLVWKLRSR